MLFNTIQPRDELLEEAEMKDRYKGKDSACKGEHDDCYLCVYFVPGAWMHDENQQEPNDCNWPLPNEENLV